MQPKFFRLPTAALAIRTLVPAAAGLCLITISASADRLSCSRIATISVSREGLVARNMRPDQFVARSGRRNLEMQLIADTAPRRILILLDLDRRIRDEARKAMMATVIHLALNARPEDRLGLKTLNGPAYTIRFEQPREMLLDKLNALSAAAERSGAASHELPDEISSSLDIFGSPTRGDAIIAFFAGEPDEPISVPRSVREKAARAGVRLFGLAFGRIYSGSIVDNTIMHGSAINDLFVSAGGAIYLAVDDHPQRSFKFDPATEALLRRTVWRAYGQIVETYAVRLSTPPDPGHMAWTIQVTPETLQRTSGLVVRYPKFLPPCEQD